MAEQNSGPPIHMSDDHTAPYLALHLLAASTSSTADTYKSLLAGESIARCEAEGKLAYIRVKLGQLFDAKYMPTESAIMHVLYPSKTQYGPYMPKPLIDDE